MTEHVVKTLTDPSFLIAMLVAIAVFATVFTLLPALGGNQLKSRMKSVALEREELRAKQRARLAVEADRRRKGLREQQSIGMRNIVERLDLRRALADEATLQKLKVAGFRGQNPLTRFLFFRLVLPLVRPAMATVAVFTMIPIWNDLWFPLILAPSEATKTVTLGAQLFLGQYVTNWNAVLAALSLAILPVLVLYVIFSRQLIRGITSGAVK